MDDDEWSFEPITDIPGVPTVYDDDPNPVIGVIHEVACAARRAVRILPATKGPAMTEKFNAVTITLGVLALVALVLAGVLAIANHPLEAVVLFLGISSTCVGVLAPSPVPKAAVQIDQPPDQPVPVAERPGYQPDTQSSDQAAKAQRLAHAKQVLLEGSMSGRAASDRADSDMFRSGMHWSAGAGDGRWNDIAKKYVPSCGNVPV